MESYESSRKISNNGNAIKTSSGFGSPCHSSKVKCTKYVHFSTDYPPNVLQLDRADSSNDYDSKIGHSYYWRRPVGAVRSKPGEGGECDRITVKKQTKKKVMEEGSTSNDAAEDRNKVNDILKLFRERVDKIMRTKEVVKRVDWKARRELEDEGKLCKEFHSMIGHVPGVNIGAEYKYRVELMIVGLHRMPENGIDHMCYKGRLFATCIVATEGHSDKMSDPNVLIYIGEGGKSKHDKTGLVSDQKLKGGNLALWNSWKMKYPVRVVKGVQKDIYHHIRRCMVKKIGYKYDGLYEVVDCKQDKGLQGNLIFKFKLLRCPGQPTVSWRAYGKPT